MSPAEKAVAALDAINTEDPDAAHSAVDAILRAFAPPEVREAAERVVNRAPWWATA